MLFFLFQNDNTYLSATQGTLSHGFLLRIASILKETDEHDLGAFYMREKKLVGSSFAKNGRVNGSDATPRTSRRSSRVSFKLPSPQLHHPSEITTLNLADYMDEVLILRKMVEEFNHLVSVFDCDETDMDGYVISALLSSGWYYMPKCPKCVSYPYISLYRL